MAIFVFCMNLLVAAFALAFVAEISALLIGCLGLVWEACKRGKGNETD